MRFRLDESWARVGEPGDIVLAGSPLRIFRLSAAGAAVAARIEAGDEVASSTLTDRLLDAGAVHPVRIGGSVTADQVAVVTPQLGGCVAADRRITVDDGSIPPLVGAALRLDENRGPAAARNAGRAVVNSPFIAFVDADVECPGLGSPAGHVIESWWDPLLAHFEDPEVGLVAPRITGDRGSSLDLGAEPARIRAGSRVGYVPAAMVIVRSEAFDDVGGFDETMRFGEDVDFVWRLDQAGWKCRYEPASSADHRPRATLIGRLRQQAGYGSSSAPLALRHPRSLAPYRSNHWSSGVWLLVLWGHPVAAVSLAATSAAALVAKLDGVPATTSIGMASRAQLRSGEQLARAMRRAWWPILLVAALVSRRARLAALASILLSPRTTTTDLAFGWGMWRSMFSHREWRPAIPEIVAWSPGRRR